MKDEALLNILKALHKKCAAKEQEIRCSLDLTEAEYKGLLSFEDQERITCQEFSERMNLSVSRGSRVIERLFAKGYIDRRGESSDRRCKLIWLTEKGAALRGIIEEQIRLCEKSLISDYSETKIRGLKKELKNLGEKL